MFVSERIVHITQLIIQETFDILVPRNGVIRDLYPGLQKKANIDDEMLSNVRIYEAHAYRVYKELDAEFPVATISEFITLYAEIIPEEERNAEPGDTAIYCFHFDKEPNKLHGIPFKFLVKPVSTISANRQFSADQTD